MVSPILIVRDRSSLLEVPMYSLSSLWSWDLLFNILPMMAIVFCKKTKQKLEYTEIGSFVI